MFLPSLLFDNKTFSNFRLIFICVYALQSLCEFSSVLECHYDINEYIGQIPVIHSICLFFEI